MVYLLFLYTFVCLYILNKFNYFFLSKFQKPIKYPDTHTPIHPEPCSNKLSRFNKFDKQFVARKNKQGGCAIPIYLQRLKIDKLFENDLE